MPAVAPRAVQAALTTNTLCSLYRILSVARSVSIFVTQGQDSRRQDSLVQNVQRHCMYLLLLLLICH